MKISTKYNCSIVFLLLVSVAFPAFSQSFVATAKLDTNAMLIGDQVKLDLRFSFPDKTLIRWPVIGDTIIHGIQVIDRSMIDTSLSEDKKIITIRQTLRLTSFDSGFYMIPSIRFYYRQPPDTAIKTAQTELLLLKVHTVRVDTTKAIKPIKGPLKVPLSFREILPYLLLGILIVLVILGVIYYFNKKKKSEPIFQMRSKIELPPHEIAIRELEKLRLRKLWQEGRVKEYHSELTDIVRRYMERKFSMMAMEMTSMEILGSLQNIETLQGEVLEKLNYLLTLADLVKFAKMQPLPTENDISMNNAVSFVHETTVKKDQIISNDVRN